MNPSVISNGNGSGNPQPQQHQQTSTATNTGIPHHHPVGGIAGPGTAGGNHHQQPPQDPSGYAPHNVRGQFPHFTQGFGFDPDMDDMFSDSRIRSRLPRMRDPFGTFGTRKRCGFDTNIDPYKDIFEDGSDDFFSGFGRRRNPHDFFDFPDEFRQYIPEGFGIPRSGSGGAAAAAAGRTHPVHPTYQQPEHPVNTVPHPQYAAPPSPHYDNVPVVAQSPKPNLCDASIQTDADLTDGNGVDSQQQTKSSSGPKINKRFNLDNDENRGPRSQSAPPHQNEEMLQQQKYQQHQQPPPPVAGDEPIYVTSATFSTSAPQSQGKFPKMKSQGTDNMPPHPPQRQQQSFYLHNPGQGQTRQWPPPPQPQTPPPTNYAPEPMTPGGTVIRTIPIFVEGRKDPIFNEHKEIPGQTTPTQQQQPPQFPQPQYQQAQNQAPSYTKPPSYQKQPFAPKAGPQPQMPYQKPPQQTQYQEPYQPYQAQAKPHPTLDVNQPLPESDSDVPPQTPQTMDCINKIQNIQRDVLHLMEQVEAFGGLKNDKEYMYLDEMLTRNLLKLDTIDTNGKDSIRLARKEAIKCIQASINVLEAKAGENARKTGKFEVRHDSIEEEPATEKEAAQNRIPEENPNVLNDQTVIPLPPPPEHKSTNAEDIKKSGSQTSSEAQQMSTVNKTSSSTAVTDADDKENKTEKVPSKSKIPVKGSSPSKEISETAAAEVSREKERSQSKSPSKSPTKAKEGAKKKIIKKIKKLTKKDSKDEAADDNAKQQTEAGDKSDAPSNNSDEKAAAEPTTELTEKKE